MWGCRLYCNIFLTPKPALLTGMLTETKSTLTKAKTKWLFEITIYLIKQYIVTFPKGIDKKIQKFLRNMQIDIWLKHLTTGNLPKWNEIIMWKNYFNCYVYSSKIHNNYDMKLIQMSINYSLDKEHAINMFTQLGTAEPKNILFLSFATG